MDGYLRVMLLSSEGRRLRQVHKVDMVETSHEGIYSLSGHTAYMNLSNHAVDSIISLTFG